MWIRNDAEVIPKGSSVAGLKIEMTKPKPTSLEILGSDHEWESHDIGAIHQDDEIYVPLSWINRSNVFDVIIKVIDKENDNEQEVRDSIDAGELQD